MALLGVTGASGLIGTSLVKIARERGHDVRLFSRGALDAIPLDLGSRVDPLLLEGCDVIIHLAARLPSGGAQVAEAPDFLEVNALGTLRLMEAMCACGIKRMIQASAANAYAPWCSFPNEDAALYPLSKSLYLGSKVVQEIYAQGWGTENGIEVASLRISSPYGSSPRSVVGRMAAALLDRQAIDLEDGGSFGADFVLASDVAEAILLLESSRKKGIWNVGSGMHSTILEIATTLAGLTNADPSLLRIEPKASLEPQGFPAIDIDKIRSEGFAPTPLHAGLRTVVDELRSKA
jgi:UDP-glucose 4-epimerase